MHKLFIFFAATLFAGSTLAADISGKVNVDVAKTASDDFGASMSVDLDIEQDGLGGVALSFGATDGDSINLNNWNVSTETYGIGIALGDDHNLLPEADGNSNTLASVTQKEALKVSVGDANVVVQFDDWKNDLSDIDSVQGSYTLNFAGLDFTASGDYNLDTENTIIGAEADGFSIGSTLSLGAALTYDIDGEKFAYEGRADAFGISTYINGDTDDSLQNIGSEYEYNFGSGIDLTAGLNYNLDDEDLAPSVGVSFSF